MTEFNDSKRSPAARPLGDNNAAAAFDPGRRRLLGTGGAVIAGALLGPALSACGGANAQSSERPRLLQGGMVLTMEPGAIDMTPRDVMIEGGKITQIGPKLAVRNAEVIDASGMIVMPGLVDGHRHLWMGLLKNTGPNARLGDFLGQTINGTAPFFTPDDVYIANLISAVASLRVGITTVMDWSHIGTTPDHTDMAIKALQDSGIRALFGYGANLGVSPAWYQAGYKGAYPADIRRLRPQYFNSPDQLLTLSLAAQGPELAPLEQAVKEFQFAKEVGARYSIHVGFGEVGNKGNLGRLAAMLQALGTPLGAETTYLHTNTILDSEWDMIAASGGTVSIAPQVEMQMGHGMPAFAKMRAHAIVPSLSIDIETNQPGDMFTPMRATFQLQRAQLNELNKFASGTEPSLTDLFSVRDVLEMATVAGAKSHGLTDKVGTLTVGKQADVIMLKTREINVGPINDPFGAIVLGMDSSNVDSVFVAGKAMKRGGVLIGVDEKALFARAQTARNNLLARAGFPKS